jgi:hypothetical protein
MDKWYISANGRVTGPLNIDEIQRLIAKSSDLYGWNPSYSHWLPVTKIKDFSEFISEDQSSEQVSKELIDKFVNRKRDLNKKVALINSSIEVTIEKMALFEREISKYKELTTALSADVQDNIVPLEKKYNSIGKQLNDLQKALAISKQEIEDAVQEFGGLVLNKTTEKREDFAELIQSTATPSVPTSAVREKPKSSETNKEKPTSIPAELRGTVVDYEDENNVPKPSVVPIRKVTKEKETTQGTENFSTIVQEKQQDQASKVTVQDNVQTSQNEKIGFKNKLKSVFGKQNNDADLGKLSDRLLSLEKEAIEKAEIAKNDKEEEVVFLDYDVESKVEDDESDLRKKHRRRRRF